MKNFKLMAIATGLLMLSSPAALFADDTSDAKPADKPGPELREKLQKMTPDERKQWMKDHPDIAKRIQEHRNAPDFAKRRGVLERAGLKPEALKDLSPTERRDKVKDLIDKRVTDLEKKKTDGTALTEQEQEDLDTLKQMRGMMNGQSQHGGHRQPKTAAPANGDSK